MLTSVIWREKNTKIEFWANHQMLNEMKSEISEVFFGQI